MTPEEFISLTWALAFCVIFLVISWVYLVLQAFFHDKRIALTGVFSASCAAMSMAVSPQIAYGLLYLAGFAATGFILWFIATHAKNIWILLASAVFLVSAAGTYWVYWQLAHG